MPAPLRIDTWRSMEQHRARVDQHKENQARLATSYASFTTTGWGEIEVPECFDFSCIFVEQPFVSDGTSIDQSTPVQNQRFPHTSVGVGRWRRDADGNYTGAWLVFKVTTVDYQTWRNSYPGSDPSYKIHHHLKFEGVALKALPTWVLDINDDD